jgi:hypothetical protein
MLASHANSFSQGIPGGIVTEVEIGVKRASLFEARDRQKGLGFGRQLPFHQPGWVLGRASVSAARLDTI